MTEFSGFELLSIFGHPTGQVGFEHMSVRELATCKYKNAKLLFIVNIFQYSSVHPFQSYCVAIYCSIAIFKFPG